MDIATLNSDIADVKNTASSEVEFNNNSLQTVVEDISALLSDRGIPYVADVATMQALSNAEANIVAVKNIGLFYFADTAEVVVYYDAAGGGKWNLFLAMTLQNIVGIPTPTPNTFLRWNGSGWLMTVPGWSEITGKPTTLSGYGIIDKIVTTTASGVTEFGPRQPGGSGNVDTTGFINISINGVPYKLALIS